MKKIMILFFISILCLFCSCTSNKVSEISEEKFNNEINKFNIDLNYFDLNINDIKEEYKNKVGSSSYESLNNNIIKTYNLESSKTTTYLYMISQEEIIDSYKFISIADKTPAIYLLKGNKKYNTGKCSNVVGISCKSKSQLTIKNSIFENMSGIDLWNCSDITIENCYFLGAENGIHLANCKNVTITNSTFIMNDTGLTDYYQGIYLGDGNSNINISNCYFESLNDIKKPMRCGSVESEYEKNYDITFSNCISIGHFLIAFQNIAGFTTIKDSTFILDEYNSAYSNPLIVDSNNEYFTTIENANFYLSYKKKISNANNTVFLNCKYNLLSN